MTSYYSIRLISGLVARHKMNMKVLLRGADTYGRPFAQFWQQCVDCSRSIAKEQAT